MRTPAAGAAATGSDAWFPAASKKGAVVGIFVPNPIWAWFNFLDGLITRRVNNSFVLAYSVMLSINCPPIRTSTRSIRHPGSGDTGMHAFVSLFVKRALKTTDSGDNHSYVLPNGMVIIFTPAGEY